MVIFKKASGNLRYGDGSKPCTPVVHIKIAGLKWMFIPVKMVLIGIDPYPYGKSACFFLVHFFLNLSNITKGHFPWLSKDFWGAWCCPGKNSEHNMEASKHKNNKLKTNIDKRSNNIGHNTWNSELKNPTYPWITKRSLMSWLKKKHRDSILSLPQSRSSSWLLRLLSPDDALEPAFSSQGKNMVV